MKFVALSALFASVSAISLEQMSMTQNLPACACGAAVTSSCRARVAADGACPPSLAQTTPTTACACDAAADTIGVSCRARVAADGACPALAQNLPACACGAPVTSSCRARVAADG